jgi:hypothetical protein
VVWDYGENEEGLHRVAVGAIDRKGDVPFTETMPLERFITKVTEWYEAADKGEL